MRILKKESIDDTEILRAIRRLEYIQDEIAEAINYLESDAKFKDATCKMALELYRANDLKAALFADSQNRCIGVKTESADGAANDVNDEDMRFKKAWDSIGFHGGGGTYSAEEFLDKIKKAGELATNSVSVDIPDKIDSFLQDVAQMTNIISYNDIIKFGNKLSKSEQYRKYALEGIEHLISKWGEALLYEDELMMDDIAYDVKSYMTFPLQRTVTKQQ